MERCGMKVAPTPSEMGSTLVSVLEEKGLLEKCIVRK
jgi:succinyl-CoA synthetase alpha subunit